MKLRTFSKLLDGAGICRTCGEKPCVCGWNRETTIAIAVAQAQRQLALAIEAIEHEFGPWPSARQADAIARLRAVQDCLAAIDCEAHALDMRCANG